MDYTSFAQEIVDHLQGTCDEIMTYIDNRIEEDDIDEEWFRKNELQIMDYVDNRIFNCSQCGWWCEAGDWVDQGDDYSGEEICSDCG